jgi:hypothetical protein
VATAAIYQARWQSQPYSGPWVWVLGPPPTDPDQLDHHREGVRYLRTAIVDALAAEFSASGLHPLPSWARRHLEHLANAGIANAISRQCLAGLGASRNTKASHRSVGCDLPTL